MLQCYPISCYLTSAQVEEKPIQEPGEMVLLLAELPLPEEPMVVLLAELLLPEEMRWLLAAVLPLTLRSRSRRSRSDAQPGGAVRKSSPKEQPRAARDTPEDEDYQPRSSTQQRDTEA